MSDSDDTDVLLHSDPHGGLGTLLKPPSAVTEGNAAEVKTVHNDMDSHNTVEKDASEPAQKSSTEVVELNNLTAKSDDLDSSTEYFNSKGEIILDGIPEWTDASELDSTLLKNSDPELEVSNIAEKDEEKSVEKEKTTSPVSTTSANSEVNANSLATEDGSSGYQNENINAQITSCKVSSNETHNKKNANLIRPELLINRMVDVNLSSPVSAWNIPLPKVPVVSRPRIIPQGPIVRAPNFRTPGGYKPPKNPKPCRNLTDDEIFEEVKKMYQEDSDDCKSSSSDSSVTTTNLISDKVPNNNTVCNSHSGPNASCNSLSINFTQDTSVPTFSSGISQGSFVRKGGKVAKKRHTLQKKKPCLAGAGDFVSIASNCSVPSHTDSTCSLTSATDKDSDGDICKIINSSKSKPTIRVSRGKRSNDQKSHAGGDCGHFDPVMGDISPIRGTGRIVHTSPNTYSRHSNPSRKPERGLYQLKDILHEIRQETDSAAINSLKLSGDFKELRLVPDNQEQRSGDYPDAMSGVDKDKVGSPEDFDIQMHHILQELDLDSSDFKDILNDVEDEDGNIDNGLEDIIKDMLNGCDRGENTGQDFPCTNAAEYCEKFFEEKLRRQECEAQLNKLQEEILEMKQQQAVCTGKLHAKNMAIVRLTSWVKRLIGDWKCFKITSETAIETLRTDQNELNKACSQYKDRIEQYEKELMEAINLADDFKLQLKNVQESKEKVTRGYEQEITSIRETLQSSENEKKALCSKIKELEAELQIQQTEQKTLRQEFESLTSQNNSLGKEVDGYRTKEANLRQEFETANIRIQALVTNNGDLKQQLDSMFLEKENTRKELEKSINQKLEEQHAQLHAYYEERCKKALKSAMEKAAEAESALSRKMKDVENDTRRRISESNEKHQLEVHNLKACYEKKLQDLTSELQRKQALISSTVQQLQNEDLARTLEAEKLQTLVDFPNLNSRIPGNPGGDNSLEHCKDSRITSEYARFIQHLPKSSVNYSNTKNIPLDCSEKLGMLFKK